jgi:hypothetical protein
MRWKKILGWLLEKLVVKIGYKLSGLCPVADHDTSGVEPSGFTRLPKS